MQNTKYFRKCNSRITHMTLTSHLKYHYHHHKDDGDDDDVGNKNDKNTK